MSTRALRIVHAQATATRRTITSVAIPAASRPRKPSPYRLPSIPTFRASFTPLEAAGWRLERLGGPASVAVEDLASSSDLQDARLTRAYPFPRDKDGWRALTTLLGRVGHAVEAEDVGEEVITAAPAGDLPAGTGTALELPETGYVLYVATHTHTPMPPLPLPGADGAFEGKPRPGVTTKDLRLAECVERLFEEARYGEVRST